MDAPRSQKIIGASIFLLTLFLNGCSAIVSPQPPYISPKTDKLPTEQPSSTSHPLLPSQSIQLSPTNLAIDCKENLHYIDDITIPDWTNIEPGDEVDKQWQVENNGTCDWDYRYSLRLISGESMGVEPEITLFPARAGSKAIIQITFISPLIAGTFQSVWQAYNPSNQPFGDPLSILIVVIP